jgi:hypothetical protein
MIRCCALFVVCALAAASSGQSLSAFGGPLAPFITNQAAAPKARKKAQARTAVPSASARAKAKPAAAAQPQAVGAGAARARTARSAAARHAFEVQTGYPDGRPGYIIEHVVPLACGGTDTPANMQWETASQAKAKDRTERAGCR